jgi:hypothetical protein
MTSDVGLSDAGSAVAVVDAPIKTREDGGVDASDPPVVAAGVVFGAVSWVLYEETPPRIST